MIQSILVTAFVCMAAAEEHANHSVEHANDTAELAELKNAYAKASKDATDKLVALQKHVAELYALKKNDTLLDAQAQHFLRLAGENATRKDVSHDLHTSEKQKKNAVKHMAFDVKRATRTLTHLARKVEKMSKRAGVSAKEYEAEYDKAEELFEHTGDKGEDLGADGQSDLEDIFESLEDKVDEYFAHKRNETLVAVAAPALTGNIVETSCVASVMGSFAMLAVAMHVYFRRSVPKGATFVRSPVPDTETYHVLV
jgi:hypothetical protein